MTIDEQYRALQELIPQIEEKLKDNSFEGVKNLILWLTHSAVYQKLKNKENSLILLEAFCEIWMEEKKENLAENDIFTNIKSLSDIQKKYREIQYTILRIENQLPEEYCNGGIKQLITQKISGIAIVEIAIAETLHIKSNIIKVADYLMNNYAGTLAIEMLQYAQKKTSDVEDFILKEADCWIFAEQWEMAIKCLEKITNPDDATMSILNELRQVGANEEI